MKTKRRTRCSRGARSCLGWVLEKPPRNNSQLPTPLVSGSPPAPQLAGQRDRCGCDTALGARVRAQELPKLPSGCQSFQCGKTTELRELNARESHFSRCPGGSGAWLLAGSTSRAESAHDSHLMTEQIARLVSPHNFPVFQKAC